jgi:uncharacterized protein YjbI with pentapeptide repeats
MPTPTALTILLIFLVTQITFIAASTLLVGFLRGYFRTSRQLPSLPKRVRFLILPRGLQVVLALAVINFLTACLFVVVGGYTGEWVFSWTGFGDYTKPVGIDERGKTLWDWLDLLIIPAVLAVAALWLNRGERNAERVIEDRRSQEATLQIYLDRMTELLLKENLRGSKQDEEVRAVARARTLTALRQIADAERKATLVQFLVEANLVNKTHSVIDLDGADLTTARLRDANFREVDLSGTHLHRADMSQAKLAGANLSRADMSRAQLVGADLRGADLSEVDLSEAFMYDAVLTGASLRKSLLPGAQLNGANLRGTDFTGAILRGSDLPGANLLRKHIPEWFNLPEVELSGAVYDENTTWPEGFTPPPDASKEK